VHALSFVFSASISVANADAVVLNLFVAQPGSLIGNDDTIVTHSVFY